MVYYTLQEISLTGIIRNTVSTLKAGGIVLIPFDTVYGFIADATDDIALERIFKLKERSVNKTIGIAVSSLEEMKKIAKINDEEFIKKRIPGPYTFILDSIDKKLSKYCYHDPTIAVRVPDNELIIEITKVFGPIAQTSANKSGKPNCFSFNDVKEQFSTDELKSINLVIDGGEINSKSPSEIWNLSGTEPKKIER